MVLEVSASEKNGVEAVVLRLMKLPARFTTVVLATGDVDTVPVMMSLVQGMVMQQAIDGQPPFDDYRAAVRALFESAQ